MEKKPDYQLIAVLMSGAFIAFLSNTFLNVALPSIMKDFNVTTATVQWVTTGYMLVNGIVIPTTAFLMQRFTARQLFLTAMLLFLMGTIIAGFSPIFTVLIIGRMVQAAGAAIMMPLLMNIMMTSFPPRQRGTAMGIFTLVLFFAPAIGPTLSGFVVQYYSWHYLFYMIVPIILLVLIVAYVRLPKNTDTTSIKIDVLSIILSTIAFGGILYGFSAAGNKGWLQPGVILFIMIGFITLFYYVRRQLQLEKPMLNFRVYEYRMFMLASLIVGTLNMALFSGMMLMPIYLQNLRSFSPIDTGLLLLPGAIIMGLMSPISGKLFDMLGPRKLAVSGLLITTVTTFLFSRLSFETSYFNIIIIYSIRAFGMSLVMTPVMTNGLNSLPNRLMPHGSAMNSMLNQVSGAVGTALLITLMQNYTHTRLQELIGESGRENVEQLTNQATLDGINFSFVIATSIMFISFVLTSFLKRTAV
ncbi:DHA2 family efflux MFS transporter permease subunit [Macrococcus lamae]|uniref:Quinolone resistance protein NorB n=1 Tax=Macrococcus lamae TaxID=198484 RepID=A0A4R6BUY8_9STAP|nr:DHA2 family efflux MFS transporter permease subunit [Macrococcus lamae]TDM12125.1 DHA2 family efflux MFS transporter permease subunit [Macrococcus lamae]